MTTTADVITVAMSSQVSDDLIDVFPNYPHWASLLIDQLPVVMEVN